MTVCKQEGVKEPMQSGTIDIIEPELKAQARADLFEIIDKMQTGRSGVKTKKKGVVMEPRSFDLFVFRVTISTQINPQSDCARKYVKNGT